MALDLADFPLVYQVGGIRAFATGIEIEPVPLVTAAISVINVGETDAHVRALVRRASGNSEPSLQVFDSADLGGEAQPFDLVKPEGFAIAEADLDPGFYWFQIYVTAATLVPTVDVRIAEFVDGDESLTPLGRCYPGDFAITHQRLLVLGGVAGLPGTTGTRIA
jgi:hypothetical protein